MRVPACSVVVLAKWSSIPIARSLADAANPDMGAFSAAALLFTQEGAARATETTDPCEVPCIMVIALTRHGRLL